MFKKVNPKEDFPKLEKRILKFWKKNNIFHKSVESRPKNKIFSFYDGPPYATGLPHYGHLLAGTIKDVVPRYQTMRGYRVERVWGWDTHGLPIENIVEQQLGFKTKRQIKEMGIGKFNNKCREIVLKYTKEWEKIVERTGRWVDMKNAYITMDIKYMESVWWVFKSLWDKKLIYKGHKVMPYCPRCATGLSNFELGMEYQNKIDRGVTVKFELEDEKKTYLLAWTTTPWTLPGNLALAVGKDIKYLKVSSGGEKYILAKENFQNYKDKIRGKIEKELRGQELVGRRYQPLFYYYSNPKEAFKVISGDFVSTKEGTGIVHIAPAFGEDDYQVAQRYGIDFFMPVDDFGNFTAEVPDYFGQSVVSPSTNKQIIKDLGDKVLKVEDYSHSYPHCWRCKTPLIYKAISSWFVKVSQLKKRLIKNNRTIHWVPEFVGKNRFQNMLETAPDWNISRNRFWGVPLPVWICQKCQKEYVFGRVKELEHAASKKINDIHLHKLIGLKIKCQCGGKAKLTGEVLDVWFDSGSMPYASIHYPFENQVKFKKSFPADFIAEGIDQTRGWFNSLLILGTALFNKSPYKNVVVNGIVLAEDGQKMSKSLKNYPDPLEVISKYGADSMRFYLMASPAVRAEDLCFSERGVEEIFKKLVLTLWNVYSFFTTYALLNKFLPPKDVSSLLSPKKNILDRWILAKTNKLIEEVTSAFEEYNLSLASRLLLDFIDDFSNWYVRRSRRRFWKNKSISDKKEAHQTLYFVLIAYVKLLAPFMPFVTEEIYKNLVGEESIHLSAWPKVDRKLIDEKLIKEMAQARKIVEEGLALRAASSIKLRQPLLSVEYGGVKLRSEFESIIKEELNVKEIKFHQNLKKTKIDTRLTKSLRQEGIVRDLIRYIQSLRKRLGLVVSDKVILYLQVNDSEILAAVKKWSDKIVHETNSLDLIFMRNQKAENQEIKIDGKKVWIGILKQ